MYQCGGRPQLKGRGLPGRTVEWHKIDGANVTGGRGAQESREKNSPGQAGARTPFLRQWVTPQFTQCPGVFWLDMSWSYLKRTGPDVPNLYTSVSMTGS